MTNYTTIAALYADIQQKGNACDQSYFDQNKIEICQLLSNSHVSYCLRLLNQRTLPASAAINLSEKVSFSLKQQYITNVLQCCIEKNNLSAAGEIIKNNLDDFQKCVAEGNQKTIALLLNFIIMSTPETSFKYYNFDKLTQDAIYSALSQLMNRTKWAHRYCVLSSLLYGPIYMGLFILQGCGNFKMATPHGSCTGALFFCLGLAALGVVVASIAAIGLVLLIVGAIPAAIGYAIDHTIFAHYKKQCLHKEEISNKYNEISLNRSLFWSEPVPRLIRSHHSTYAPSENKH